MTIPTIPQKIHEIRGYKVMLDFDLAELYEVSTKSLNQAVKRNILRFPADFMFRLSIDEWAGMRSQIVTASTASTQKRNTYQTPYAFTEQGLAMLSGVLKSPTAIEVNIAIMRAFVFIRQYALSHKDLTQKLKKLEHKYDKQFKDVYEALNFLIQENQKEEPVKRRKKVGFKISEK